MDNAKTREENRIAACQKAVRSFCDRHNCATCHFRNADPCAFSVARFLGYHDCYLRTLS